MGGGWMGGGGAWAKWLKSVGMFYFSGIVDNIDSLLELYKMKILCLP